MAESGRTLPFMIGSVQPTSTVQPIRPQVECEERALAARYRVDCT